MPKNCLLKPKSLSFTKYLNKTNRSMVKFFFIMTSSYRAKERQSESASTSERARGAVKNVPRYLGSTSQSNRAKQASSGLEGNPTKGIIARIRVHHST